MELKANELRLNNWVYAFKTTYQIDVNDFDQDKVNTYQPIPLTEEWLLKFEKINWIYKDINGIYYWFNGEKKYLKFVHSLQNTYFCIEQKEVLCVNI